MRVRDLHHTLSRPVGSSNEASDARVRLAAPPHCYDPSRTFVPHRELQQSLRCKGPHGGPASLFVTPHADSCPIGRSNKVSEARVRMAVPPHFFGPLTQIRAPWGPPSLPQMPGSAWRPRLTVRDPSQTFVPHRDFQLSFRSQGPHGGPASLFYPSNTFVPHRELQLSLRCQGPHGGPASCFVTLTHFRAPQGGPQLIN